MSNLSASQDLQQTAQFNAVQQTISNDTIATAQALDSFCKPIEEGFKSSSGTSSTQDLLTQGWQSIICTAASTKPSSSEAQKLADFVLQLQSRGTLKDANGQAVQVERMNVWDDLPTFGWSMRDAWNASATDSSASTEQSQWIALNAWTATLISLAHTSASDSPDFSLYAIWTIRSALEDRGSSSSSPVDETALTAAAVWFQSAALALWDFCRAEKAFDGKLAAPGTACKDQGWNGFSRDRWRAWAERLSEVQGLVKGIEAIEAIEAARKAMGDVIER